MRGNGAGNGLLEGRQELGAFCPRRVLQHLRKGCSMHVRHKTGTTEGEQPVVADIEDHLLRVKTVSEKARHYFAF